VHNPELDVVRRRLFDEKLTEIFWAAVAVADLGGLASLLLYKI